MSKSDNKAVKKIYSERQVNQKGIIPLIYKENINYLINKIEELEKRIEYLEKEKKTMICSECGKVFIAGNRPDGLPNGTGFVLSDGTVKNVCTDCIIKKGEESARPHGGNK